ncbi:MAG: glycosyltransferase [Bacteroidetes bacterium]|nr:glycosyltransferase [Bacteroidota bacterium]
MVRKRIALVFIGNYKSWSGGIIYILNIINTLNEFEDIKKPEILIIHSKDAPIEDVLKINYPYLQLQQYSPSILTLLINRISRNLFHRNFLKTAIQGNIPYSIYPYNAHIAFEDIPKKIYWIPDFQYLHLPQMFSPKELKSTTLRHRYISTQNDPVVFSSHDAMKDYKINYPDFKNKLILLKFAQQLPHYAHLNIHALKLKFNIEKPYFFVPNQFWKHKNHLTVLKAIEHARSQNKETLVVFSGNENDHRNKTHIDQLRNYIIENKLEEHIRFLGFIDRLEQLAIMNHAIAIIQPSLFEGWSTVVEDAKAMNKFILLSNIPLHKEQIQINCAFFEPLSQIELAELMLKFSAIEVPVLPYDYNKNIEEFKDTLSELILN